MWKCYNPFQIFFVLPAPRVSKVIFSYPSSVPDIFCLACIKSIEWYLVILHSSGRVQYLVKVFKTLVTLLNRHGILWHLNRSSPLLSTESSTVLWEILFAVYILIHTKFRDFLDTQNFVKPSKNFVETKT